MKRGPFCKQICCYETLADYRKNILFSPRFFLENIYFHESFRENMYVKDNTVAIRTAAWEKNLQKFEFVSRKWGKSYFHLALIVASSPSLCLATKHN
jgi:hypothetical protein